MEVRGQVLLEDAEDSPLLKYDPVPYRKYAFKLKKACRLDGFANECLRHIPKSPLAYLTHLFHHCLQMSHFSKPWNEAKS
jgi:hypothetical protein